MSIDLMTVNGQTGKPSLYSFTKIWDYLKKKVNQMKQKIETVAT